MVFEGNERVGQMVRIAVHEASPFTLYGTVVTGEQVGVEVEGGGVESPLRRVGLTVV